MENTIYLGLSRQVVLQNNMTIIANNVANVNTPGYRAQNLMFAEHLSDPKGGDDELSFVYDKAEYKNTQPGPVTDGATHFHATFVSPSWSRTFTRTASIGNHRFYRQGTRVAQR
jgi:flagellar basal body rod protein FlgB